MPVEPGCMPVPIAAALTRVTVGKTEWPFVKSTPSDRRRKSVGVRSGVMASGLSPSTTNTMTNRLAVGMRAYASASRRGLVSSRITMKICFFHLMPYRFLPEDFERKDRSVWVAAPHHLFDAEKTQGLYQEFLDELEFAEKQGFDGLCVNEHHNNAYGLMPSPHIMAATMTRRTSQAALGFLGNSLAAYNPPLRVAEEFAMLDL